MPTYLVLLQYTEKGLRAAEANPPSQELAARLCQSCDSKLKQFYLAAGPYHVVLVCEAPSNRAIAKLLRALSVLGSVRTETLLAVSEPEFLRTISEMRRVHRAYQKS